MLHCLSVVRSTVALAVHNGRLGYAKLAFSFGNFHFWLDTLALTCMRQAPPLHRAHLEPARARSSVNPCESGNEGPKEKKKKERRKKILKPHKKSGISRISSSERQSKAVNSKHRGLPSLLVNSRFGVHCAFIHLLTTSLAL